MNKTEKPVSTLWGCELSSSNKAGTFKTDDSNHQHQLALRTMCLGAGAKEEFNIVEVITGEPENGKGVPMATLHANGMPTVNLSGLDLHPPVTFRLKSGTGPVYVCGEHVALEEDISDSDEDMAEELEEEEEEIESSPEKPVKKPAAKNGVTAGKRKKQEADGSASDGENNPPKKGKGRGKKKA
ncbi:nucleoplasmin-2b [Osmerus eperlanus]|uniref:nucleoplasmin-2b n=1 Tax=Osmerus eperlanus TaxID=29151 RepID=UPI002E0D3891